MTEDYVSYQTPKETQSLSKVLLQEKLSRDMVRCGVCERQCVIHISDFGLDLLDVAPLGH